MHGEDNTKVSTLNISYSSITSILCAVKYADDCNLLKSDTDRIQGWCTVNFTKLNISKLGFQTLLGKQMFCIMFTK
jgi:hypothetical protein